MTQPKVADGRYAIVYNGITKFFHANTPAQGKWKGFTFVQVQASDDLYPVKNREARNLALSLIAADPKEALTRYGREIGVCGVCGRTLTDEVSRAAGIGPVCADRI